MRARRLLIVVPLLLATGVPGAVAFWTATGSSSASAGVGSLNAATNVNASATAGSGTVHVAWTASAPSGGLSPQGYYVVRRAAGGATSAACGSSASTTVTATSCDDTNVADGAYTYTVVARYASWTATSAASSSVTVVNDNTPPAVTLTSPADDSSTSSTTPTISGAAGTATGDAGTVTVKIYNGAETGGTVNQTRTATATAASWTTNATTLTQGTYTVQATQTDAAGNTGTSTANTFTVDTTAPTVTLTSPANGALTSSTTPAISGAAGTATGDAGTVTVKIYNGAATGGTVNQTRTATATAASWTTNATTLTQGTYTVQATQTDAAGNTGTSTANTFTVDTSAPALTELQMFDSDANGKIDQVKATFNETLQTSTATTPWTLTSVPSTGTLRVVSTSGAVATLAINEGAAAADTSVGSFKVALAASASGILDAAGNPASFAAMAPADRAAPVLVTVSADNQGNGQAGVGLMQSADTFVMTFSEALAAGSVPTSVTATESTSAADTATLTIPGLINSASISNTYLKNASAAGSSSNTTVTQSAKTITATIGSITETNGGLTKGTGAAPIVPAATLTDVAGNGAATTSQNTGLTLF